MYYELPLDWNTSKSILERFMQENQAITRQVAGPRRRPDQIRNLIAQAGSLEVVLTWNLPARADGITGYRVYKDNELSLNQSIKDPLVRTATIKVPANTATAFYVTAVNANNLESIPVQVIGQANTDQYVVTGSAGATVGTKPSFPPNYTDELGGGGRGGLRR